MEVAYTLNRRLYPYLLPSIMSLLKYNEVKKIWILAEDEELPYSLPEECEVIKVDPADYLDPTSANYNSRWTPFCLVRVATPRIIPSDRVLQLDVDTIICDSLLPIWELDMGDNLFAMVNEKNGKYKSLDGRYFNAGVTLWNLKQIREEHIDSELIELVNVRPLNFPDQDAINMVALGRIIELNMRYNECFVTGETKSPAIVHYASFGAWWESYTPRYEWYAKWKQFEQN